MTIAYLIKGLIIGFSVAAPVGPIGVLTIKRTLTEGRLSGFMTGLGAALADSVYGVIAGFGLTAVSSMLLHLEFWMKLTGGIFLVYLGLKSILSKPAKKTAGSGSKGLLNHLISTFFLTISNPVTILSFLAIFAGLGLGTSKTDYLSSMTLVVGVFLGSAMWWLFLSYLVSYFETRIDGERLVWINRISGILLISFGLFVLVTIQTTKPW